MVVEAARTDWSARAACVFSDKYVRLVEIFGSEHNSSDLPFCSSTH